MESVKALLSEVEGPDQLMIDATHLKAHRTAASLLKKEFFPAVSVAPRGGLNSKLHAVCDGGWLLVMLLSEGQMSDYKGAALMIHELPKARAMLGDRGDYANCFGDGLVARGITPCIPSKANRKVAIPHDRTLYRSVTRSRTTVRQNQKAGAAFTPATIASPTPSCLPSASQAL